MTTEEHLDALLGAVREERGLPAAERATGAGDEALDSAASLLESARTRWGAGDKAAATELMNRLAHQVGDGWSYTSTLARDILACAQALRRLA